MFKRLKLQRIKTRTYNWADEALGQIFGGLVRLLSFGLYTLDWPRISLLRRLHENKKPETYRYPPAAGYDGEDWPKNKP